MIQWSTRFSISPSPLLPFARIISFKVRNVSFLIFRDDFIHIPSCIFDLEHKPIQNYEKIADRSTNSGVVFISRSSPWDGLFLFIQLSNRNPIPGINANF